VGGGPSTNGTWPGLRFTNQPFISGGQGCIPGKALRRGVAVRITEIRQAVRAMRMGN